jgi:hypothetical protein
MIKHQLTKRLALGMRPQISFETRCVNNRDERFDRVQYTTWFRCVLRDVTPKIKNPLTHLLFANTAYTDGTQSAGAWISQKYIGSINRGVDMRKEE